MNATFWSGKKVLVTGHTGFKGSWLSLWLLKLGARLSGYGLSPASEPALFKLSGLQASFTQDEGDIRDEERLRQAVNRCEPEIVFHLAAQPLVRQSYTEPVGTFATNVMGTVHLLEAIRQCPSVRAAVIVTTDKVYENREWLWGYRENERLGGKDPYSASKACAELATRCYAESFLLRRAVSGGHGAAVATARAGNIIGGGDWSEDRLVPDCLRALAGGTAISLRNPSSVRPWQHVLASLDGYLRLAQRLYLEENTDMFEAWNFGPSEQDIHSVEEVAKEVSRIWGGGAIDSNGHRNPVEYREANLLQLDSAKARTRLGWAPPWDLKASLEKTVEWHRAFLRGDPVKELCLRQIGEYEQGR